MDEDGSRFYLYRHYAITTFREGGGWWAKGAPRAEERRRRSAVRGGPWKLEAEAKTAAQAFCDGRQAG